MEETPFLLLMGIKFVVSSTAAAAAAREASRQDLDLIEFFVFSPSPFFLFFSHLLHVLIRSVLMRQSRDRASSPGRGDRKNIHPPYLSLSLP